VVPNQSPFFHWVVYKIPPTAMGIVAGVPFLEVIPAPDDIAGAYQAYTAFSFAGYRGPQPPPGELHHYRFLVYALDADLDLKRGMFANAVFDAVQSHIIGEGEIATTYERQMQ